MKKINVLSCYFIALFFVISSCSNEENEFLSLKTKNTLEENYEETAYSYCTNSTCFIDNGFNRWGWTNGPIYDRFDFELYAGAGQCDINKGNLVGRVSYRYNSNTKKAKIKFATYAPYILQETHLYIGTDKYPLKKNGKETVAPGNYPYQHTNLGGISVDEFFIDDIFHEGNGFYMIAHAVVTN